MKNDEARQAMVNKVNETFAKYRSLSEVPDYKGKPTGIVSRVANPADQASYIAALYVLFENGHDLGGRMGDTLIGV